MTDEEYIIAAIELADFNFPWDHYRQRIKNGETITKDTLEVVELDGLAAQLVRQVDDLGTTYIHIHGRGTEVDKSGQEPVVRIASGRTMNTIKAIVDSGVLCTGDSDG